MSIRKRWTLWLLLPIALIAYLGCESDVDRIRATNEADRASQTKAASTRAPAIAAPDTNIEATPPSLIAEIDASDVREGDCIISRLPEDVEVETFQIVTCSGDWQFRVISSFSVEADGSFPGDDYFVQQGFVGCNPRYTYHLIPTKESWEEGDRTINCLQERYGLGLEKLDRLKGAQSLNDGECIDPVFPIWLKQVMR